MARISVAAVELARVPDEAGFELFEAVGLLPDLLKVEGVDVAGAEVAGRAALAAFAVWCEAAWVGVDEVALGDLAVGGCLGGRLVVPIGRDAEGLARVEVDVVGVEPFRGPVAVGADEVERLLGSASGLPSSRTIGELKKPKGRIRWW